MSESQRNSTKSKEQNCAKNTTKSRAKNSAKNRTDTRPEDKTTDCSSKMD